MSKFTVPIVQIGEIFKHPNADKLETTNVEGYPVVMQTDTFKVGDLAVYLPLDAVVPLDRKEFAFLKKADKANRTTHRVKALKLRGVFSVGLLIPAPKDVVVGDDVASLYGVIKYEEPAPLQLNGETEKNPGFAPVYDVENYRKYKEVLVPGELVSVTEKLHGSNLLCCYKDGRFWVSSHREFKKKNETNLYWRAAIQENLEAKLSNKHEGLVLYGEVFGSVQDLKYGTQKGQVKFAAFDIFNTHTGKYLDVSAFRAICNELDIPTVPVLYEGPYHPAIVEPLADGQSTIATHIREGVVIRPVAERWHDSCGRVILKLVSENYLLRSNGTEYH